MGGRYKGNVEVISMAPKIVYASIPYEEVYRKLCEEAHSGAYTSYIRGKRCKTEDDFFREISASFQFPDYFGENWAALDECICDLEWLKFERLFVLVDDFAEIFSGNNDLQKLLIKYLEIAVDYWRSEQVSIEIVLNN